jgi:type II secretion system protein G
MEMKKCHSEIQIKTPTMSSFTIIELLGVVGVIGIVAGIVLAAAGGVQKKAARDQAKAEIQTYAVALEKYRADFGAYPGATNLSQMTNTLHRSLTNYVAFRTNQLSGSGTNIALLDPYGYPYRYRSPAVASTTMLSESFEIFSVGANGQSSLDSGAGIAGDKKDLDDIKSW